MIEGDIDGVGWDQGPVEQVLLCCAVLVQSGCRQKPPFSPAGLDVPSFFFTQPILHSVSSTTLDVCSSK
jgi:hypothetical protein